MVILYICYKISQNFSCFVVTKLFRPFQEQLKVNKQVWFTNFRRILAIWGNQLFPSLKIPLNISILLLPHLRVGSSALPISAKLPRLYPFINPCCFYPTIGSRTTWPLCNFKVGHCSKWRVIYVLQNPLNFQNFILRGKFHLYSVATSARCYLYLQLVTVTTNIFEYLVLPSECNHQTLLVRLPGKRLVWKKSNQIEKRFKKAAWRKLGPIQKKSCGGKGW